MIIGDINVVDSIISLEMQVHVLNRVLDQILANNNHLNLPSAAHVENFRQEALRNCQQKYPNMGIEMNEVVR